LVKKISLTIKDEALEEILSFQQFIPLGYITILIAVFAVPIMGLTFGVDKLFKVNIRTDAYAGAISFAASLALVGEAISLVDRRKKNLIERQTFYNLQVTELPEVEFEYCYFEDCTFDVDLSTVILKGCSFSRCRFSSRIGRSVERCRFRDCSFSGATIDPGFFFRHSTRACDFTHAKTGEVYPHSTIDTDYPPEGWIGWLSCEHNARSPHLRCAINPTGPCDGCLDFTRPPVLTDVRSVFLDLPRRLRKNVVETCANDAFDPAYDKYATDFANGLIQLDSITEECYETCIVFEELLEAVEQGTSEGEALSIIQQAISTHEEAENQRVIQIVADRRHELRL
jgi:predicted RNase H-like HicB family nuclease